MSRETHLIQSDSLLRQSGLVLGGSLLIAIAAQVSVPMYPVPMTLQTLAILLVGFALGSRLGALALVAYLAEGAMGLPVFANGMSTAAFAGPTVGFLFGFIGLAWLAGFAAENGMTRNVATTAISAIVASALLYIPGAIWPMFVASSFGIEAGWVGIGTDKIWAWFMAPFLLGDLVKAIVAALIVTGAWKALRKNA